MKKTIGYRINIFLFLLPALFLFIGVLIAPIAMSAFYSLHKWSGFDTPVFIGLKNYVELFTSMSIHFPRALKNALLLSMRRMFSRLPAASRQEAKEGFGRR